MLNNNQKELKLSRDIYKLVIEENKTSTSQFSEADILLIVEDFKEFSEDCSSKKIIDLFLREQTNLIKYSNRFTLFNNDVLLKHKFNLFLFSYFKKIIDALIDAVIANHKLIEAFRDPDYDKLFIEDKANYEDDKDHKSVMFNRK